MQPATDLDDFASSPVGRYLTGRSWIHFCADAHLFGVVFWGRPDRESTEALIRSLRIELAPSTATHESLVDARLLEGVDSEAFDALGHYVRANHDELAAKVSRLALIRPLGLTGAITAGFYQVLDAPYPVRVFDDPAAALGWLSPAGTTVTAELSELIVRVTGTPPLIAALRSRIGANPRETDLRAAAASVNLSERTLQRHLRDLGTTYQRLVLEVRIEEAKRLLRSSTAPITRIAVDVGFASAQHFSNAFRKIAGKTPSAWRRQPDPE